MIEESLFKKHFVGRDGFFWWMGQVAPANTWTGNMPSGTQGGASDLPGFKQRVKVRIMGYHTASFEKLPDEDLPWAYLMFPVTAGSGGGGMSASSSFSGGEIVFGFFLDGEDGQQPVVMGLLDKSTQQTLSKDLPEAGFVPFSGYANGSIESRHNIKAGGGSGKVDKFAPPIPVSSTRPGGSQAQVQPTIRDESAVLEQPGLLGGDVESDGRQAAQQNADATGDVMPANPCPNDEPQSGIALEQKRLQKVTAFAQKYGETFTNPLTQKLTDIAKETKRCTDNCASYMKKIVNKIRIKTLEKIAQAGAKIAALVPVDLVNEVAQGINDALEKVGCVFNNMIDGLKGMLGPLLGDLIGKTANSSSCGIDTMIGNVVGGVLGTLQNGVQGALSGVNNTISAVSNGVNNIAGAAAGAVDAVSGAVDAVGGAVDAVGGAIGDIGGAIGDIGGMLQGGLDKIGSIDISFDLPDIQELISGLKELFSCEEETKCTDIKQASMLTGNAPTAGGSFLDMVGGIMSGKAGSFPEPIGSVMGAADDFKSSIDDAKSSILGVADAVTGVAGAVTGAIDDVTGAASGVIDSVTGIADFVKGGAGIAEAIGSCNMGPEGCGTPTLQAFGKDFSVPPVMNAIISPAGKLLGADILGAGADLLGMNIDIKDNCGKGSGGYGKPILDDNGSLTDVVFTNTGGGYLPGPDGSVGGNGIITAEATDTVCILPEGDILTFGPGEELDVPPGTTVYFPSGSTNNPVPSGTTFNGVLITSDTVTNDDSGITVGDGVIVDGVTGDVTVDGSGITVDGATGDVTVDGDGLPGYGIGYVFGNGGHVSAPVVSSTTDTSSISESNVGSSNQYPVIMALSGVQIEQTGIGYNPGDTVTVSGFDGNNQQISITGDLSVGRNGELFGVQFSDNDLDQKIGFVEPPSIRVNTKTGAGAGLIPYLKVKYRGEIEVNEAFQEGFSQDAVISVIDCVGATPIGYVNGRPYYGPSHIHPSTGRRMVGAEHVSTPHDTIYNTAEESITRTVVPKQPISVATPKSSTSDSETGLTPGIVYETDTPDPVITQTPSTSSSASSSPRPSGTSSVTAPSPTPTTTPTPSPSPSPSPGGGGSGGGY